MLEGILRGEWHDHNGMAYGLFDGVLDDGICS